MSLTAFLTAAAMTLMPGLSADRAQEIVDPIAATASSREDAALLLATNFGESTFRRDVETCRIVGDNGKAMGAYQLHPWLWGSNYGRRWVCLDPQLSARLALFALRTRGSLRSRIARFMGRAPTDKRVLWREGIVKRILRATEPKEGMFRAS